ncbi:sodium-dependent transporter [bacterium]|nr:sodium-dependent transporter [bacterium]
MNNKPQFSNRWGLIFAALGMAIGAGNLWRFPRLAGQYGGTFILLWIVFLLVWSIPILMAEFSMGKVQQKGVIGAFAKTAGRRFTWMGFFIAVCTLGITFYYSVVTGWGLRYFGFSLSTLFSKGPDLAEQLATNPNLLENYWKGVSTGNIGSVVLHIVAVALAAFVLIQGVQKGFEKANKILIPVLFVLLVFISGMALSMGNGIRGLQYMFTIDPALFRNPTVWIEALSQSAWSTGAGWGLIMTIASYSRKREDVSLNIFIGAFGNNAASLLAGMAVLPAVFALAATDAEAIGYLKTGNYALTFNVIPQLFAQVTGGAVLSAVFFGAFFLAAFSSLLSLTELLIRLLTDLGISRAGAVVRGTIICGLLGVPSALSLEFLSNQDWVWGIGLVISGLFIVFAVWRHDLKNGIMNFKKTFIDPDSDIKVPNVYFLACMVVNIPLAVILIYWWMSAGYDANPWFTEAGTWNLMGTYSNATIVTQWGLVLLAGILLNNYLYKKFTK